MGNKFIMGGTIAAIAFIIAYVLFSPKTVAATDYSAVPRVQLSCLSLDGRTIQNYSGPKGSIYLYDSGSYAEVKLSDRTIKIPQHRCEFVEIK